MRIGLPELPAEKRFDVCVIGAGFAGIVLARKLAESGQSVVLLEGGEDEYSDESQDIYKGAVVGDAYFDLDAARLRFLGGSSNHWGGWCRQLDAADFEAKAGLAHTAWPIRRKEIDPFYAEAAEILELTPPRPDTAVEGSGLNAIAMSYSPPVFLKEKYGGELDANPNITLVLNANFISFATDGERITHANVSDYAGLDRKVKARDYVLAAGGIENSRLLLWCDAVSGGAVTRSNPNVGRYWMEHPHATLGDALLAKPSPWEADENGVAFFSPTASTMADHGILNCGLRMRFEHMAGTKKQIADLACVAPDLATWIARQFDKDLFCGAKIRAAWEQEPRFDNRVELGAQKDAFGMPRPILHWSKSVLDTKTPRVVTEMLGKYLASRGLGRVRVLDWVVGKAPFPDDDEIAGYHHMGGTRMAATAQTGVVDRDGKVFGQDNLYVAGSSVFPSGGHANPTLTIVQLALRLADHLAAES